MRTEKIVEGIEKEQEWLERAESGKIEINFKGRNVNFSFTKGKQAKLDRLLEPAIIKSEA